MSEVFIINGIEYDCVFKLTNPDKQEVSFTKSAVRGMTISDTVFDPFKTGVIAIANAFDNIEDKYFFRGDGRDEMFISFKPTTLPKGVKDADKDTYTVEETFSIIGESSDVVSDTRAENIKRFMMISKNAIKFSDTVPYGKTYSGKVGDILKEIFTEILGADLVSKKWESGDGYIKKYIPNSSFRYVDLIRFFMKLFYAKSGDLYVKGFITFNKKEKKYQLELLTDIYADNNKNVMESFAVGDLTYGEVDLNNPNNPISNATYHEYIGGINSLGYSTPTYGVTSDFFINRLIYGYDDVLGIFKSKKLMFEDVRKRWASKFVDVFKSNKGKVKLFGLINNSTDKKFKRYSLPYDIEESVKLVEADIHNTLTFYNLQLSFDVIGSTNRTSGKFLDIFTTRNIGNIPKSDEKLLGRWYVTETQHIFFGDMYNNKIMCTKTYIGPDSDVNEDVD